MKNYVVGFLFDRGKVALIRKVRPNWQKGRLNGIGGHIEKGETPHQAMCREFREETGAIIGHGHLHEFVLVIGTGYRLHCFAAHIRGIKLKTTTDEKVVWKSWHLLNHEVLDNLHWLIPMANYKFKLRGTIIHDNPEC